MDRDTLSRHDGVVAWPMRSEPRECANGRVKARPKTQVVTGLTRNGLFLVEDGQVSQGVRNLRFTQSYAGALAPGQVKAIAPDARLVNSSAYVPSLHLSSWNFTGGARG